jgi:hemolysin III
VQIKHGLEVQLRFNTNEPANYEEIANTFTHAIGIILFFFGSLALLIKGYVSGNVLKVFSAYVFGGSLVLLYTSSTCYHGVSNKRWKGVLQKVDHAAIFILIAGTYTPFLLVALYEYVDISFIIIMWVIALVGIIYKILPIKKMKLISTLIYLAMGWMAVFKIRTFYEHMPIEASIWVLIGGLFYSVGTIFYSKDHIPHHHALWHIFVLCGSASHFVAIYLYVY